MNNTKNKYVDLSNCPTKNGHIDWKNSVGCVCNFTYGDLSGEIKIIDYIAKKKNPYLLVQYNDRVNKIQTSALKKGTIGNVIGEFTSDFKYKDGEILSAKNQDIMIIDHFYKREDNRNRKFYHIKCLTCNQISEVRESSLKKQKGCPVCASKIIINGVNDIPTTTPWMVDYFPGGKEQASKYTSCSMEKIKFICPCCKQQIQKAIPICYLYYQHGIGCGCDTFFPFPERIMYNLLSEYNIKFVHCATKNNVLPWAKKYRYDFYLNDYNTIIETHGLQHFDEHGFGNIGGKTLEEEQENDKNKRLLAVDNHITKYFEIDCRKSDPEFIINSCIESGLFEYLGINYDEIDIQKLMGNIFYKYIKEAKELILQNESITKEELANKLKISVHIVNKILNILNVNIRRKPKNEIKPIYVYKDGEYVATFSSFYQLYTNSEEVVGINIRAHDKTKYVDTGRIYKKHYTFSYNKH